MFHLQLFSNVKVIAAILLVVMLVGCGGGRSNTTSSVTGDVIPSTPSDPAPSDPAPSDPLPSGTGSAVLNWLPPTTHADGSTLSDLAGHNIYVDDGKGYTQIASIKSSGVTTYVVENLTAGTYTFVVTAFDSQGVESVFSNTADITI